MFSYHMVFLILGGVLALQDFQYRRVSIIILMGFVIISTMATLENFEFFPLVFLGCGAIGLLYKRFMQWADLMVLWGALVFLPPHMYGLYLILCGCGVFAWHKITRHHHQPAITIFYVCFLILHGFLWAF